jgi:ParB-like chromosome segregation protein Spo0J
VKIAATRLVALDGLKTFPGNPRRGDVKAIARSLDVNGQFRALIVRAQTNEVLGGNHTLLAMRELGWAKGLAHLVECDDVEAKRIVLADNRTADASGYDDAALADLLSSLPDLEGTGYDDAALQALIADFPELPDDSQPRLDQRAAVKCPGCGHEFVPAI